MITSTTPEAPQAASTTPNTRRSRKAELKAAKAAAKAAAAAEKAAKEANPNGQTTATAEAKNESAKATHALAAAIRGASESLGFASTPFNNGRSVAIKLPLWENFKAALAKLSPEGAKEAAQTFHALKEAVETLTGDTACTFVVHASGSFAIYGKLK